MTNKQDLTIGCLSLSALVLLAAIFVVSALQSRPVMASGMSVSDGKLTMLTGRLNTAVEMIYIIDTKTDMLAAYRLNEATGQLMRTNLIPMDERDAGKQKPLTP